MLSYIFYWLAVMIVLPYMKYKEVSLPMFLHRIIMTDAISQGAIKFFGYESAAYRRHNQSQSSSSDRECSTHKDDMEGDQNIPEGIHASDH